MKYLHKIAALAIVLGTFAYFYIDCKQVLTITLFGNQVETTLALYSAYIFTIGFIAAVISEMGSNKLKDLRIKEYEKKLGTTSVDNSKDKSKIEALERKVMTLEKALENNLKEDKAE